MPGLTPLLPEWIWPDPIRYRRLHISFRNGSDSIPPDTGVYTLLYSMEPIISDPIPKLLHPLPEWIRSYPIRYRSVSPFFRNGSDPMRSDTGAYTPSSGMDPTLPGPIPELIHYLPMWNRSHPIRYPSLCISFRNGPDPIRPDTELIFYVPEWIRSYPIRYQSL
jgi:hypothetical protein